MESPKQFFLYTEFICGKGCEKNFEPKFQVFGRVPDFQNLGVLLNLLRNSFWNHFQAEIISESPLFLNFILAFFFKVWNNWESWESWLGFWISRHSKMLKLYPNKFFLFFWVVFYGFTNYFDILNHVFWCHIRRSIMPVKCFIFLRPAFHEI